MSDFASRLPHIAGALPSATGSDTRVLNPKFASFKRLGPDANFGFKGTLATL